MNFLIVEGRVVVTFSDVILVPGGDLSPWPFALMQHLLIFILLDVQGFTYGDLYEMAKHGL